MEQQNHFMYKLRAPTEDPLDFMLSIKRIIYEIVVAFVYGFCVECVHGRTKKTFARSLALGE